MLLIGIGGSAAAQKAGGTTRITPEKEFCRRIRSMMRRHFLPEGGTLLERRLGMGVFAHGEEDEMDRKLGVLIEQMMEWDRKSHERIGHNLRVLGYATAIAKGEGADDGLEEIVAAAAVVHDAGIRPALERHGSSAGPYQEQEGAEPAGIMLRTAGYSDDVVQRVQELVAHHHTYRPVLGMDHQILLEADLLVNLDDDDPGARQGAAPSVIKTPTGLRMYDMLFGTS